MVFPPTRSRLPETRNTSRQLNIQTLAGRRSTTSKRSCFKDIQSAYVQGSSTYTCHGYSTARVGISHGRTLSPKEASCGEWRPVAWAQITPEDSIWSTDLRNAVWSTCFRLQA